MKISGHERWRMDRLVRKYKLGDVEFGLQLCTHTQHTKNASESDGSDAFGLAFVMASCGLETFV